MKRFIEGADRAQITLFPDCLDDHIAEDNPARAVEAFIDALDLGTLGFEGVVPAATGRPSYHPSVLLKPLPFAAPFLGRKISLENKFSSPMVHELACAMWTGRVLPNPKSLDNSE